MTEISEKSGRFPKGTRFFQGSDGELATVNPESFKSRKEYLEALQGLHGRFPREINEEQFNAIYTRSFFGK